MNRNIHLTFSAIVLIAAVAPATLPAAQELPPPGMPVCESDACVERPSRWRFRLELLPGFRVATGAGGLVLRSAVASANSAHDLALGHSSAHSWRSLANGASEEPVTAKDNLLRLSF